RASATRGSAAQVAVATPSSNAKNASGRRIDMNQFYTIAHRLAGDPPIHGEKTECRADDNPPGLPRWRRVFGRKVILAIRAALGILVNLAATIWTRNGRFFVLILCKFVIVGGSHEGISASLWPPPAQILPLHCPPPARSTSRAWSGSY